MGSAGLADYRGMKKIALLALLPLTLGSCGLFGTPKTPSINGSITGTAPTVPAGSAIKIAVVGLTATEIVNDTPGQVTGFNNTKYSTDYPSNPSDGRYIVVAFVDKNNDGKFNLGETSTSLTDINHYLVYSKNGDANLKYGVGWNYVKDGTPSQPLIITDYDLKW